MKNKNFKLSLFFSSSILLFVLSGVFILSLLIPDYVLVSDAEKEKHFVPDGSSWLCRVIEEPSGEVWQNSAEKLDGTPNDNYDATVYFCGILPIKTVEVKTIATSVVKLGGNAIGISLDTDGILVVGIADVITDNGTVSPAKDAGMKKGDIIRKIDGITVSSVADVTDIIKKSKGELVIEGKRGEKEEKWIVSPLKSTDSQLKIGLWIRDSVSGIGTLTFSGENGFGALGHPISDVDTGTFVKARDGDIYYASIVGVDRGQKGVPGSLCGIFTSQKIGSISQNTPCGVFGKIDGELSGTSVPIGKKEEIKCCDATLLCDVGDGVEQFDVEIVRVLLSGEATKGMVLHITDSRLIEKTGGIVQGMSGAPLVQNGKLIGAVTHVFVNDPTRGYGIFIENMLSEAD